VPASATHVPRPYLPADARRSHLLEVAGTLVRRGGWSALSMQGLAVAAGLSRQLVYERFGSADQHALATLTHLFERAYDRAAAITATGRNLEQTVRAAFEQLLDLPAEELQALRSLAGGAVGTRSALARARIRLRNRIASIWVPYVAGQTGASDAEATALAWMSINAGWALADLVADGTLARRRAVELYVRFVVATLGTKRRSRT
jgi:AcrR family transcriptional regulator